MPESFLFVSSAPSRLLVCHVICVAAAICHLVEVQSLLRFVYLPDVTRQTVVAWAEL